MFRYFARGCGKTRAERPRPASARAADQGLDAGLLDRPPQAVEQPDPGLPAQDVARPRDVGPADLRVVGGERLVHDLRPGAGDLDDGFGELTQRVLVRV